MTGRSGSAFGPGAGVIDSAGMALRRRITAPLLATAAALVLLLVIAAESRLLPEQRVEIFEASSHAF